ncbi:MAG: NAD(P)-dependent dehydrogenase (short-subunit alcohol dehydrogenase family) [Psychrosphaera sp.]|jgi:NAD(P)-dependent dehydrogenase (short-subunit alcohol dehydrogenase family)|uniref:SDR family oxidoreductase n=1 Tax=Psychrosphaera aquimarina TaxID=2044854 RepID=A0ABU3R026_9GAMM|nr:SDR family oxidoreductase [Psychrosphaera aquimarina]MDU0113041.1 SDR family oxidoreductase [Psychrosphaera aquimarina]
MKTAVITGANRGIGLAISQQLAAKGWDIIAICRSESEEIEAIASMVISGIDVTNPEDIQQIKKVIGDQQVDLLINNAGLLKDEVLGKIDYDSLREQFEINALSPLQVTEALIPNMVVGSKIANITSRMGSIADNDSGGRYGYRASKAALNAIGKSLAEDLKTKGIAVAQLHPGWVQTRMVEFSGLITTEQSAAGLIERIEQLDLSTSGGFWHSNGEELPW